jgi:hypothetical protein
MAHLLILHSLRSRMNYPRITEQQKNAHIRAQTWAKDHKRSILDFFRGCEAANEFELTKKPRKPKTGLIFELSPKIGQPGSEPWI